MAVQRKRNVKRCVDFHAGLNNFTSPLLVKESESAVLQNVDVSEWGKIKKATSYAQLGDTITGTGTVGDIYLATTFETGGSRTLVVAGATNKALYSFDPATAAWTERATTGLGFTSDPSAVSSGGILYIADSTAVIKKVTAAWSQSSLTDTGDSIAVDDYRLYIAGTITVDSVTYRNRVYFTEPAGETFPANNYFTVDGESVAVVAFNDLIWVFCKDRLYRWDGYSRIKFADVGVVNKHAMCIGFGRMYFLNKQGVWAFDGTTPPKLISRALDWPTLVASEVLWANARLACDDKFLHVFIPNQGTEYLYDPMIDSWIGYLETSDARVLHNYDGGSTVGTYFVTSDRGAGAKVYYKSGYQIYGASTTMTWQSGALYCSDDPARIKQFRSVYLWYKPIDGETIVQVQYRIDGGSWTNFDGTASTLDMDGSTAMAVKKLSLSGTNCKGKYIEIKISDTNNAAETFYGFEIDYDLLDLDAML